MSRSIIHAFSNITKLTVKLCLLRFQGYQGNPVQLAVYLDKDGLSMKNPFNTFFVRGCFPIDTPHIDKYDLSVFTAKYSFLNF